MNLLSYLKSWWLYDPGETIDEAAYLRFLDWLAQPKIVKPIGWRGSSNYRFENFYDDMTTLAAEGFLIKKWEFERQVTETV
jgi:hypothetical protein